MSAISPVKQTRWDIFGKSLTVPVHRLLGGAFRQVGVSEQTFYRWKKRYNGLEVDQV
jgi:L-alanine-DL-glutamate epimerase-like enolase superfamily enzyme